MIRTLATLLVVAAALSFGASRLLAGDYPEPSPYSVSWELKFEHGTPKRIVVTVPGEVPQAYWYMTYKVTNNTGSEQLFLPTFELLTKDGEVIRSDKGVSPRVFDSIKQQEGNTFLERRTKLVGTLRQGDDQAREGVAIWKEPSPEMGAFSIFVTGLSGEATTYKLVDGKLVKIDPRHAAEEMKDVPKDQLQTLRKTLMINYVVYGDEKYADRDEVTAKGQKWVMR